MAKFKAEITDAVKEWRVEFEDNATRHEAFKIALEEMKNNDSCIVDVYKGLLCEYGGQVLFDDSKALFVTCTEATFDGLSQRWEEEI